MLNLPVLAPDRFLLRATTEYYTGWAGSFAQANKNPNHSDGELVLYASQQWTASSQKLI